MKRLSLAFALIIIPIFLTAQPADTVSVMFYNVENLFDTIDQPNPYQSEGGDDEYHPGAKKEWTADRYEAKLKNLAQVINSVNNGKGPDLAGFCEVENQYVLWDLINRHLVNKNYGVVYKESPDARSIDVALIYRLDLFSVQQSTAYTISLEGFKPTRDILRVDLTAGTSTLTVFVNHWPSKSGGAEKSDPYRMAAAKRLKGVTDQIQKENPAADFIILGDLNCNADEAPIREGLGIAKGATSPLSNLTEAIWNPETTGTLQYRGKWDLIDQVIVSDGLMNLEGFSVQTGSLRILNDQAYREQEGKFAGSPFRTYAGDKYLGGFSDHFAVTLNLILNR